MLIGLFHVVVALKLFLACDYVPPRPEEIIIAKAEYPPEPRSKREASWDWIRIEVVHDPSVYQLTEEKKEVLEDLVTAARDYFETSIKVHRVTAMQLNPSCTGRKWTFPDITRCLGQCEKRCGGAVAPQTANYFKCCTCIETKCVTDQSICGGKIVDTDFVLFVSLLEDRCGKNTLAYAAHCGTDPTTKRPLAGHVNVCLSKFKTMKSNEFEQWLATLKHELIHAFVFSPPLFKYFPNAGKPERTRNELMTLVPNVVHRFMRFNWETLKGPVVHDVYMIVTPKVREEVRRHFNCSTLEGAELENQGGRGTVGAHWEKRIFENEAMSGVATQVYALSRLTLALFEDSGWYKVNYAKAEDMLWGRNLGCTFAKKSCLTWMKLNPTNPYPFCRVYEDSRCSETRSEKVICTLRTGEEPLPLEYNYNIDKLYHDKKGQSVFGYGGVTIADYCPYYRIYGVLTSEASDTRCTFPGNLNYNNYSLEIFSPTARCFQLGEGGIEVGNEISTYTWLHSVGCYESICKDNILMIKTQNSEFYPCYREGQLIHIEKRLHGVGTVKFRIVCPPCAEICSPQFCAPDRFEMGRIGDFTRAVVRFRAQPVLLALLMLFLYT
uniref:Leishmanolysin-like peptidase n=1 Tax=Haemonchus contortus TaxID=6289 RepID=A0A7I4YYE7_HAECO